MADKMWRVGLVLGNEVVTEMVGDRSYVAAPEVNTGLTTGLCQLLVLQDFRERLGSGIILC